MAGPVTNEPMKSQQKCVAVFALLCCCAVLLALIFSAVDLWGDDEDGITEENCNRDCSITLVENIPEDLPLAINGMTHVPLTSGLHSLLDRTKRSVEVVSPVWDLNSWDQEARPNTASEGQLLFRRLIRLRSRGVQLKVVSSLTDSAELRVLAEHDADVRFVNMTALSRGSLRSSFWVVDRKHVYIGSAGMDWRALSKRKELGVIIYNCSCLALDLQRIFSFYWQLQHRDYIPSIWSKRVTGLYSKDSPLSLTLNRTEASAYVSASPEPFCPKDRTKDVDAINKVIRDAKRFIYISVPDYLPLLNRSIQGSGITRYWSAIDENIREAVVLRRVRVRMLISFWKETHPLTFNFVTSLLSLCMELSNCSLEAKLFSKRDLTDGIQQVLNHNKYVVTDSAVYIGNHDWVGRQFVYNAGAGLVVQAAQRLGDREPGILEQVKAVFDRDWTSRYARSLLTKQGNKYRNVNQPKLRSQKDEKDGEKSWNNPL